MCNCGPLSTNYMITHLQILKCYPCWSVSQVFDSDFVLTWDIRSVVAFSQPLDQTIWHFRIHVYLLISSRQTEISGSGQIFSRWHNASEIYGKFTPQYNMYLDMIATIHYSIHKTRTPWCTNIQSYTEFQK